MDRVCPIAHDTGVPMGMHNCTFFGCDQYFRVSVDTARSGHGISDTAAQLTPAGVFMTIISPRTPAT